MWKTEKVQRGVIDHEGLNPDLNSFLVLPPKRQDVTYKHLRFHSFVVTLGYKCGTNLGC